MYGVGGVHLPTVKMTGSRIWDLAEAGGRGPIDAVVKQRRMNYSAASENPGDGCSGRNQITASKRCVGLKQMTFKVPPNPEILWFSENAKTSALSYL